jgi:hypothetical protein
MRKTVLASFLLGALISSQAQETTSSSAGEATGTGGSAKYSIGQVFYTNTTNAEGVQQVNTTTWDGSESLSWATAGNWSNGLPDTSSEVIIPTGLATYPTANAAVSVKTVSLASGTSLIAESTFTGSITYHRNLPTENWYLVSSPVVGETYDDAYITANSIASGTGNNRAIATYTTSNDSWSYAQVAENNTFSSGTGYSVKRATGQGAGDLSFTGSMKVDNTSLALTTSGNGYNLLGNPYLSYINSGSLLVSSTSSLTSQTMWVWNQTNNSYQTKVTVDAFKLAPGQGFFVKANISSGTVQINEDTQSHESLDGFLRTETRPEVHLILSDGATSKEAKIYYIQGTTTGFDNGYDGEMFGGVENEFAIYTHLVTDSEGKDYQVQSVPDNNYENMVIPVGMNAASGTAITISAAITNLPAGIDVYLEDNEDHSFTILDNSSNFTTTLSKDISGTGRFYMHTTASALSTNNLAFNQLNVYTSSRNNLRILGAQNGTVKVELFTMLGKKVLTTSFKGTGVNDLTLPTLAKGIYLVQLATEKGTINKKIIIK